MDEKYEEEFELIDSATTYEWTQERLEIILTVHNEGKTKVVTLFSELIRDKFDAKDVYHEINKNFN